MSVDVSVRQSGLFKKRVDTDLVNKLCEELSLSYGVSNSAYALEDYALGKDLGETELVIYNLKSIGRGFRLRVLDHGKGVVLRLNNPCTLTDLKDFYDFLLALCACLKVKSFIQDGDTIEDLSLVAQRRKSMARWNQELLEKYVKEYDNHIIFGAVYPVYMEKSFLKAVRDKGSINIMAEFARYMHNKQNRDLYYAKALVYTSEDEHLTGCYTLTQEVFSIFPVEPYIPFNSGLEPDTKVTDWDVYFVINIDGEYKTAGHVSFWPFIEYVRNKVSYTMFDEKHVILKMNKKQIEEVVKGT